MTVAQASHVHSVLPHHAPTYIPLVVGDVVAVAPGNVLDREHPTLRVLQPDATSLCFWYEPAPVADRLLQRPQP